MNKQDNRGWSPSPIGPAVVLAVLAIIVSFTAVIGSRDPGFTPGRTLNVNSATASELSLLPRIGPVLSARIIEARQAEGPFRTIADLDNVSGIGPRTLAQIEPYIDFGRGAGIAPDDRP